MIAQNIDMPPPGDFIREELETRGWAQRDLAYVLGMPEQSVNMVVSGKRGITADMARALGDAFDVAPEFFLNLQTAYELSRAKQPATDVARKGRLQSAYPVREMIKRGWLKDGDGASLEQQMCAFFEVANTNDMPELAHAAKRTGGGAEATPVQQAWLFRVRQIAREMVLPTYSEKALRAALENLHALMTAPEEARNVPRILSECGVRFVLVESLPGAKIDGVCFWLDGAPVIGMSCRHDRIDNFWFVLRHEIEHVLRRHAVDQTIFDDLDGENAGTGDSVPEQERVANAASADFGVPSAKLDSFVARKAPYISERDVASFAALLHVHPGVVAGRLRWKLQDWKIFSKLLVKIRAFVTASAVVDGWGQVAPVLQG
jgi:HTH-type transcriptional regulator/antitoxin HigA